MWRLVAISTCIGCYAPDPRPGAPCANGVCPEGLVCSPATQTCERSATDAGTRDSAIVDSAGGDARIDAPQGVVLVQQNTNYADKANTLSVTLAQAPASGHVLVMIGANIHGGLQSVTGGGVTWQLATRSLMNANIEIWYGTTDGSSATVTTAIVNSDLPMWMSVSEWAGVIATLDGAQSNSGTGSPAIPGSITTTGPALVLLGVADGAPNTFGTPTPGTWTALTPISGMFVQSEWYQVAMTAGTFAPLVTETNGQWDAAVAALKL